MSAVHPVMKGFGSKWQLSKHYPKPLHDVVREPFCATAAYSLRHWERQVELGELDEDMWQCWRWLVTGPSEEIVALPDRLPEGADLRTLGLAFPAAVLLRTWQRTGRNDCWKVSKWGTGGDSVGARHGLWSARIRDRIAETVQHLKHWKVVARDYREWTNEPATWFIDPPYANQPRSVYPATPEDFNHVELGRWCWERRGLVLVCEAGNPVPMWLPFQAFRDLKSGARGRLAGKVSKELLWYRNQGS